MDSDGAEDKLIPAVKALGNAGHSSSLKLLMKLIPCISAGAARLPHRVHLEAVLALRNIAKKEPRRVRAHNREHGRNLRLHSVDV